MHHKYKILLLLSNPMVGGTETFSINLVYLLRQQDIDARILNLWPNEKFKRRCQDSGILYFELNNPSRFINLKTAFRLLYILRNERFEIIYAFSIRVTMLLRILYPFLGNSILVHGIRNEDTWRKSYHIMCDRLTQKPISCFIANSEKLRKIRHEREKTVLDKIHVINNGIDTDLFSPEAENWPSKSDLGLEQARYFTTVANIRKTKGPDFYIDSILKALELGLPEDIRFLWLGGGNLKEALTKRVRNVGLEDRVVIHNPVSDVRPYLYHSEAFVLSSREEGQPRALLEAMSMGLPSLVTDVGGLREIVNDGQEGLIVAYGDIDNFAAGLIKMACEWSKQEKMSIVRERITEQFNQQKMVEKHMQIFDHIVKGANGKARLIIGLPDKNKNRNNK